MSMKSLIKYPKGKFMVQNWDKAFIFDIETMNLLKSVDINTKYECDGMGGACMLWETDIPLIPQHIIPETDNKFMLEFRDK